MSNEKQVEQLTNYMANFIAHIAKKLPDDVIAKLTELRDKEDSPLSKTIYDTMFENQRLAVELNRPSCQDTGVLQFWVKCGTKFPLIDVTLLTGWNSNARILNYYFPRIITFGY